MLYFTLVYFYIYRASWSNDFFCMFRKSSETQEQRPLLIRNTLSYVTVILDALKRKKKKIQYFNHSAETISGKWRVNTAICFGYVLHLCIFNFIFHLYCTKSLNKPVMILRSEMVYYENVWMLFSFLYRTVFISLNCADAVFHHVVWTPDGAVCLKMLSFWKSGKRLNLNS